MDLCQLVDMAGWDGASQSCFLRKINARRASKECDLVEGGEIKWADMEQQAGWVY